MKVVDWNISYLGDIKTKVDLLRNFLSENTCVLLQEVKPNSFNYIKDCLQDNFKMLYSLDFRKPGKFDSEARKLGVVIIVPHKYEIVDCGVVERSLFPDRTLFAALNDGQRTYKVLSVHSITGCGYYKAKSIQYDTLTL